MKTVVYGATNNIILNVIPCLNSLLLNGNVDEVILLVEEDVLPFARVKTTQNVKAINVSGQTWFTEKNTHNRWTYMSLMRAALSKLLPDHDKVLWLDTDTIVEQDLSALWDLDLTDYYYAAVKQPDDGRNGRFLQGDYFNVGVLMCNLEKLRDGKDDEIIKSLQTTDYAFLEQDCINQLCQDKILQLPGRYNVSPFTVKDSDTFILHFAANPGWINNEYAKKYREVSV